MAERKKKFNGRDFDLQHKRNLVARGLQIQSVFDKAANKAGQIGARTGFTAESGDSFHFDDYPTAAKQVKVVLQDLHDDVVKVINAGTNAEWRLSRAKNDAMVQSLTSSEKVAEKLNKAAKQRSEDALEAFRTRKEGGMDLSKRVWSFIDQTKEEFELAIEVGMTEGRSAADLSRDVRQALREPSKLFRRVRDKETGQLRLSKAAEAYHPGRGVYRSSFKNALRLTATENNMAYRRSDHERWQNTPWVLGIEISTSINNHEEEDICDELAGRYPKDFVFVGWHPFCRCFATPILPSEEEYDRYEEALIAGDDVEGFEFSGRVEDLPENFTQWCEENEKRIENASSSPYFLRDNFEGGDPKNGPLWEKASEEAEKGPEKEREEWLERLHEASEKRHSERTQEEIDDIQTRWNERLLEQNSNSSDLHSIRLNIDKYGVDPSEFNEFMRRPMEYDVRAMEYKGFMELYERYDDRAQKLVESCINRKEEMRDIMSEFRRFGGSSGETIADEIQAFLKDARGMYREVPYVNGEAFGAKLSEMRAKLEELKESLKASQYEKQGMSSEQIRVYESILNAKTAKKAEAEFQGAFPDIRVDFGKFKKEQIPTIADTYASLAYHAEHFPEIMTKIQFVGDIPSQYARLVSYEADALQTRWNALGISGTRAEAEKIVKKREYVKERSPRSNTSTYAYSDPYKGEGECKTNGIVWNASRSYADTLKSYERDVKSKYHPQGTIGTRSIIDHELGHKLDELLGLKRAMEFEAIYDDAVSKGFEYVQDNLSRYAWTGDDPKAEFIAEAWAEYLYSDSPREMALKIGKLIESQYAKKFGKK